MQLDTINNDVLDTVTGGQSADDLAACAIGAHEAGRRMESKRWFWQKPTPPAIIGNSLRGCAAGLKALRSRAGQPA